MPGSVRDLKTRLLEAIDAEGNVTNMEKVFQVVSALENAELTAEDLHVTRLGKYVNLARRKATDRGLAKRLKNLVKRWQKLLQNCTSNGLLSTQGASCTTQGASCTTQGAFSALASTPPPVALQSPDGSSQVVPVPSHGTPVSPSSALTLAPQAVSQPSTISTSPSMQPIPAIPSSPPTIPTVSGILQQQHKSDAISNRRQKLQMLSQLNKRLPLATSNTSVLGDALQHNARTDLLHSANSSLAVGSTDAMSLRGSSVAVGSTDLNMSGCEPDRFVVSIPRASVARAFSKHPPIRANGDSSLPATAFVTDEPPSSLLVSIDVLRLQQRPDSTSQLSAGTSSQSTAVTDKELGLHRLLEASNCMGVPQDCVLGIHGHVGADGIWYDWTKAIPSCDGFTVTVLPYVYIDGWDTVDLLT